MRETTRGIITLLIWVGFLLMTGTMLTTPTGAVATVDGGALFGIMAVSGLVAIVMTFAVWNGGFRDPNTERDLALSGRGSKPKRVGQHDRIERLLATLDDDDVYELEALLLRDHDAVRVGARAKE